MQQGSAELRADSQEAAGPREPPGNRADQSPLLITTSLPHCGPPGDLSTLGMIALSGKGYLNIWVRKDAAVNPEHFGCLVNQERWKGFETEGIPQAGWGHAKQRCRGIVRWKGKKTGARGGRQRGRGPRP